MIVVCGLGIAAGLKENAILLYTYCAIHSSWLIAVLVLVLLCWFGPSLIDKYFEGLLRTMVRNYVSHESLDEDSCLLNHIMKEFHCCGVQGGRNFFSAINFESTLELDDSTVELEYPLTCCRYNQSGIVESTCPANFTTENSNIEVGCQKEVQRNIFSSTWIYVLIVGLPLFLQVVLTVAILSLVFGGSCLNIQCCRRKIRHNNDWDVK
ncbi:hypothetical protein PHET_01843 [Paragonimus heterotremus]|uniref:Tetraspanin n=1 Tax=Paragonimus heterotremus TaxID=100268 RepID=A0A8J4TH22_9TREM|nr:hypothetical protein PHET_01843 [Paragonimus heterotremus]